ncbi:tape measure protein [Psychromonas arctica]|uniref:tape measure protein n=1 Tax=Psychromonas arctica TaxID=168275 RepID=UPI002FD010E0
MSIKDTLISLKIKAENLLSKDANEAADSLGVLQGKSKELRTNLKLLENQKTLIKQFQSQTAAVEKNEAAFNLLSERAVTLRKKIEETGDPTGQFNVQLEKTESAVKKSASALLTKNTALNKVRNSLDKANVDTKDLTKSEAKLNTQIDKSKSVLAKFSGQMRNLGEETKVVEEKSKGFSFVKAAYWAAGVIGVTSLLNRIKSLSVDVLTTGDKFEGLRIQMDALMGSIAEGERATEWIKTFTQNTPLQLEQVTETFARLKSFGLDPMDGSMQAIIDASEKLGGGMERVEGISLALGQAWAKQKLQGEEILQLVERGVPVWDLLEKATGRNTLELQKLSSQGKLGRDVIKQLTAEIGKSAEGAAAANMGRLTGLVSNLKDQYQLFLNQVAESGALDYAKDQLTLLTQTIKAMSDDGSLNKWAKNISDTFVNFVEGVKSSAQWLYKFKDAIIAVGETALKIKLAQMFLGFGLSASKAVASLFTVKGAVEATTSSSKVLSNVLKATLVGALVFTTTQIYRVVDAWREMKAAEDAATESAKTAKEIAVQKTKQLKEISNQLGINISSMEQFLELEEKGVIVFNEATNSYIKSNDELAKQTELQQKNAEVLEAATIPSIERLKLKFEDLQREGKSTVDAIGDIAEAIDVDNPESLQSVIDTLKILKDQGQVTATDIETGLRLQLKNLNDKELAILKKSVPETFDLLGVSIKSVANEVDPLRTLFTLLDLDLNEIRGGFTETGKTALSTFNSITETATASSDDIVAAFDGVITKVKTVSELDTLREKIEELGKDGVISIEQLEEALDKINIKTAEVTPGINSLSEAYKQLGFESQSALNKANESLRESYDLIKNSTAPIEDKKLAFLAYAKATIEANSGVITSELKVQASILGVKNELILQDKALQNNTDQWINRSNVIAESSETISQAYQKQKAAEKTAQDSAGKSYSAILATRDATDLTTLSISELNDEIEEQSNRIYANRQVQSAWWKTIAENQIVFDQQTLAIAKQTLSLRTLEQAFDATETPTLAMINNTQGAIDKLDKLDDTTLTSLNAQLDSARSKLQSLQENAESALSSVQDELDYLNGNSESIENRAYEASISALREQLATATDYQDSQSIRDLNEAIALTEKLHNQKVEAIQAESEAALAAESAELVNNSTGNESETISRVTETVVVELNLGGEQVSIPTTTEGKDDLLSLLLNNQLVTV